MFLPGRTLDYNWRSSDNNYSQDELQMKKEEINTYDIGKDYWLGSYCYYWAKNNLTYCGLRCVKEGALSEAYMVIIDPNYNFQYSSSTSNGFRPVFILKNEAKIQSGTGSLLDPYILEL